MRKISNNSAKVAIYIRLSNVDEILFIEMLVIAKSLDKDITDLYIVNDVKIK